MVAGGWDQPPPAPDRLPDLLRQAEDALKEERYFEGFHILSDAVNSFAASFAPPLGSADVGLMTGRPGDFLDMMLKDDPTLDLSTLGRIFKLRGEMLAGLGSTKAALTHFVAADKALPDGEAGDLSAKRRRVEEKLAAKEPAARTPVTVITGRGGCGKTTLLNRILRTHPKKRIAVIQNGFGEVGIDQALVENFRQDQERVVEMSNGDGCLSCTVRGDIISGLKMLIKQAKDAAKPLDFILIETKGRADLAPVAQTFFADAFVQKWTRLDGILTIVDAQHMTQHSEVAAPGGVETEAAGQLAFADRVLLSKCDLVSEAALGAAESRIRTINSTVQIRRTVQGEVDMPFILGIRAFDLDRTPELDAEFLSDNQDHQRDGRVTGVGLDLPGPVAVCKFMDHQRDGRVTSVGLDLPGEVDVCTLNQWVDGLLREKGADIFRAKGVLAVRGDDRKFVFQAVHRQFNCGPQAKWDPEDERRCRMIFIGKNLDQKALTDSFMKCYEACEDPCGDAPLLNPLQGAAGSCGCVGCCIRR